MLAGHCLLSIFIPDRSIKSSIETYEGDIRIIRFNPYLHKERKYLGYESLCSFAAAKTIEQYLANETAPDWIETQEYNGLGYFTLLFKKSLHPLFRNINIAVTVHAPSFLCFRHNHVAVNRGPYPWISYMEKFSMIAADCLLAPSNYVMSEVGRQFSTFNNKYHLLRNPFQFRQESETINDTNNNHFVFYGKASPIKGIFELLKAFERIWELEPSIKLELIGSLDHFYHPEKQMMSTLIKTRYRHRIQSKQLQLSGKIHQNDLNRKISSALAIILPSTLDNLPYAMIECMSKGKIVIGSHTGGQSEIIINGNNGFLYNPNEENALENLVIYTKGLPQNKIREIGSNAKNTVKNLFDPEKIRSKKMAILSESRSSINIRIFPFVSLRQDEQHFVHESDSQKTTDLALKPGLTVIVPFYNMGRYIDDCIQSIRHSEYPVTSIIIINDGSTDNLSHQKLTFYSSQPDIMVINQKNKGLAEARNAGAVLATTPFIAFLDPDDTIEHSYYSKAINILQHYNNVHFVGSWVRYFGNSTSIWPCFSPEPPFILYHNMLNTSSLVFRKTSFISSGGNDRKFIFGMEDYDAILCLISNNMMGVAIPELLFNYRVRDNSMMRQFTKEKVLFLYQLLAEKHKTLYNSNGAELSQLLNCNGPGYLKDNPTMDIEDHENTYIGQLKKIALFRKLIESPALRKPLLKIYTILNRN